MAGGNKSNSLKSKKRKIQEQDKSSRAAAEKKKRFSRPGERPSPSN